MTKQDIILYESGDGNIKVSLFARDGSVWLNQSQLAEKLGLKQSQISEWLKGKSKPGYDNIKLICQTLGVSADRLLGLE